MMNEHSSVHGKGLRNLLREKFHCKFAQAKGASESQESSRIESSMSISSSSMSNDTDVDMTEGGVFTDQDTAETDVDMQFEKTGFGNGKPFANTLQINTDAASGWYSQEQQVTTPVMTPINQPGLGPMYARRQNSTSSLASSVSEFGPASGRPSTAGTIASIPAPFTVQFVSLLLETYVQVCSDPTVTPFDSNNPPSGILHRVSKLAVEKAEVDQVDIGLERNSWLLTLVRQRLLKEVKKENYLSRNSSIISLPPVPQFGTEGIPAGPALQSQPSQDYFNCNETSNVVPFSLPTSNYYAGLNSPFDSRHSSQSFLAGQGPQLQQPIQMSQGSPQVSQAPVQHFKSLARSRNNSFITAVTRSRSNSFKVHPQLSNPICSVQTPPLPSITRSRSTSNSHFVLTPTTSHQSQPSFMSQSNSATVQTMLNGNSPVANNNITAAAGQQLDDRNVRLPTHLEK